MHTFLFIIQIVVSILLIIIILMQNKGTGLSSTFGGAGMVFHAQRGVEKLLHNITIVLAVLFLLSSFLIFLIS